jgi:hypothetical protein
VGVVLPGMAAPTCVIVVVKKFTYRGNANEKWSNRYALTGPTPADATAWRTLFDALVAQEKTIYSSAVSVVGGYGYNKWPVKGDHAIWNVDLTVAPNTPVPGTYVTGGVTPAGGDAAIWCRWKLDRLTQKGKPIYLRKYFHDVYSNAVDQINTSQKTALTNFAGKMRDGTFLDGRVVTDSLGTAVIGAGVASWVTTRTLKRRPKRPPP